MKLQMATKRAELFTEVEIVDRMENNLLVLQSLMFPKQLHAPPRAATQWAELLVSF